MAGSGGNPAAALGRQLRALRQARSVSGRSLALELGAGWSQSKISRIESGEVPPSVDDTEVVAIALGASPSKRRDLRVLAESVAEASSRLRSLHRGGLARRQRHLSELVRESSRVVHFQPALVPGLVQTPEYARCVIELENWTGQRDVDAAVSARVSRQDVLFEASGPHYDVLVTEAALRFRPGPWTIVRAQLARLLTLAELPRLTIRVIPWDSEASCVPYHGFVAYAFRDRRQSPIVLVETIDRELTVTDDDSIALYWSRFDRLSKSALSPGSSADYVRRLARSLP